MLVLISAKSLKSASSLPVGLTIDDVANCCSASTFLESKVGDFHMIYYSSNKKIMKVNSVLDHEPIHFGIFSNPFYLPVPKNFIYNEQSIQNFAKYQNYYIRRSQRHLSATIENNRMHKGQTQ